MAVIRTVSASIYLSVMLACFNNRRATGKKITKKDSIFNIWQPRASLSMDFMVSVCLCVSVYVVVCHDDLLLFVTLWLAGLSRVLKGRSEQCYSVWPDTINSSEKTY